MQRENSHKKQPLKKGQELIKLFPALIISHEGRKRNRRIYVNKFVEQYKSLVEKGNDHIIAFGCVACSIAAIGSIEDLREVEKVYHEDSKKIWEEIENERITTTV